MHPTIIVDVGRTVILSNDIIGASVLTEIVENVINDSLYHYWISNENVTSEDVIGEVVQHITDMFNYSLPEIYGKYDDDTANLTTKEIIHVVLRIIQSIEDYISGIVLDGEEDLSNIDINIVDKISGIIIISLRFYPVWSE